MFLLIKKCYHYFIDYFKKLFVILGFKKLLKIMEFIKPLQKINLLKITQNRQ